MVAERVRAGLGAGCAARGYQRSGVSGWSAS